MAFSLGDDDSQAMNEINLIPLIDVMLVLMIIFLVTATVLNPTIPLTLPDTAASQSDAPDKVIQISIDESGQLFWDKEPLTMEALSARFAAEPKDKPPTVLLRADKNAKYDYVAKVLAEASVAGLSDIAFVSD